MEDQRIVYHQSLKDACDYSLREVKNAMVSNPNSIRPPVESEEAHRAEWVVVRRSLPITIGVLFISSMKHHHDLTIGKDPAKMKSELQDSYSQITKIVRKWRNRINTLKEIKGKLNTQIVGFETRRTHITKRMHHVVPDNPKAYANEMVYMNACKNIREYRKQHLNTLAEADVLELTTYSGKTFGFGMACLRFLTILRRDLERIQKEYATMLEEVKASVHDKNITRAKECAELKNKFITLAYEPTLRLLAHHGFSPEEIRVAATIYSDVTDADPFCIQRCNLIEEALQKLMGTPDPKKDEQAIAFEHAKNNVQVLKNTAIKLRELTLEALTSNVPDELRSIQARETTVHDSLTKAENEVERLAQKVVHVPISHDRPADVMERVKEIQSMCVSIRKAVIATSNLPKVMERMVADQRHVNSHELLKAAVSNVKAGNNLLKNNFDQADREIYRLRTKAAKIWDNITVVEAARTSCSPNSYAQEDVTIYALREEQGKIEINLHKLHVQRLDVLSLIKAAEWIVKEGTRLLSKINMSS
jgi:hypothetical protein